MARPDTARLLRRAREHLDSLNIGIAADRFVCPVCLRVLPVGSATIGHYPSQKAGGGQHALQCADCNSRLGWDIEDEAARFLAGDEWEMNVGPPGTGGVRMPGRIVSDGPVFSFKSKGAVAAWRTVRELASRSSRPNVLVCRMRRPHPDALRMALLAWSYAEWTNYSSLSYAASAGALVVRRMLLDGSVPIPTAAVVVFENPPTPPLGPPHPLLVVHAEKEVTQASNIDEVLGIGVGWGDKVIGILPAATDAEGRVYERLEELHDADKTIRYLDLREMMRPLGFRRLDEVLVISDEEAGWKMGITDWLQMEDRDRLARDDHPRRLSPTASARRTYPEGDTKEFFMVEDTLDKYAPLPKAKRKRTRRKTAETTHSIGRIAVRDTGQGSTWHIGTHIRRVNGTPKGYAVFCGAKVKFNGATQRILNGIGLDGNGFVCGRCVEVMQIVPAELRPRPPAA